MRKFFQKIGRIYAMEWGRVLEYRIDVIAWSLAAASIPLVSLALWYNVSLQNPTGLSPQETLTYFLLVIFIKIITDAWNGFFTAWEILNGDIVKYLIRPFPMIWNDIINNTVEKCIKLLIPLPLFIFFLFSFPHTFSPQIFIPSHWLLFIPSLLLALILSFTLETCFGFLAFWLEEAQQIRSFKNIFELVASGVLIPFILMPPTVRTALSFLPFRYIVSVPAEILLGQASFNQSIQLLLYQTVWIFLIIMLAYTLWQKGLQRYAVPGQ
ncbi:MAG: hypothetical protein A3E37_01675 [Candidatus Andersenbacteria bacterium RIFCSPHIGHO2_12_FULL_46_9]|nr:MAG: hypothetical protein A3B76_01820 [Candidatus Andersenbacteria bacterium RIFCSPHIGHO2_02_FULL_46_16]OGY36755.1 MAG: hypothetical protein A3I08_04605 [Candidatus Andersenbacteria bacterium RIFCSPLOWO2_02_FULL_46_11]OGY38202.1 MAG: hypothetical protein A3E37_01675 [Candidatus Andersenbacteria bacterium RIFCSPHIGHO2_12_FULL_46_9]OGY40636.1 MAG: hypothetical protein A3G57_01410 [Candidatus Andersenbacteria bacterium RIFCSPLOWO2_12_FULL_45_8]